VAIDVPVGVEQVFYYRNSNAHSVI